MKSVWDDDFAMNPRLSQQQIVQGASVNDITCHLWFQFPNLTPKLDFFHQLTIGIEAMNGCLSGTQPMDGDPQMLHDLAGYNAQCRSCINPNMTHFRWSDIPCVVQESVMLPFDLHVFWGEGDAGKLLRGMVAMAVIFLLTCRRNLDYENLCIC